MSRSMMHFTVFLLFAFAATFYILKKADQAVEEIDRIQADNANSFMQARRELGVGGNIPSDLQTYRNEEYGFEIKYPASLVKRENRALMSDLGNLAYFWAVGNLNYRGSLSIDVWNTTTYSLDELSESSPSSIDRKYENVMVAGQPAAKATYFEPGDAGSGGVRIQKISIQNGGLIYVLECSGQECDNIISTFKFTK
jgi:hypothetical protein